MAQDSESTRAKVKRRSIARPQGPSGGRALNEARHHAPVVSHPQSLPPLTKHPQPNTQQMPRIKPSPAATHPRGPGAITGPRPHGDIAHSGGQALNVARHTPEHVHHQKLVKLARTIISAHANSPSGGGGGDTKGDLDRATADAYKATNNNFLNAMEDARVARNDYETQKAKDAQKAEDAKYSGSPGKLIAGFINMKGPVAATIAGAGDAVKEAATIKPDKLAPGLKQIAEFTNKIVPNAGKELVDLPANAVPSLYYAGSPLVAGALSGDSRKLGQGGAETLKRLTDPYVTLAKHPGKTLTEHPLSSALMVAGVAKGVDRVAGRAEQVAVPGMKPRRPYTALEEKLPGTAAKNIILPRQGAVAYRLQKRAHGNTARLSDSQIAQRTDEMFYHSVHQSRQEAYAAINHAKENGITDEAKLQEIGRAQLQASRERLRDDTVKDMALRDKAGRLRTFQGGKFDDADKFIEKWGQSLVNQGRKAVMQEYQHGDKTFRGARGPDVQTLVPRQLKTGPNKGKYVVIPKIAADQLTQHDSYLAQTPLSAVGQAVGGTFRRTVLPFSPKWLSNNYTEAAVRGGLNGIGPVSYKEATKVFGDMGAHGQTEWNTLVKSAGHGGMQRQLLQEGTTFADRLEHTKYENLGKAITRFGQKPGPRTVAHVFDKYTDVVFSQLNGRMENGMHMGMAGKVLRRNPLMSQKLVDLTHKAMQNPEGAASVEARNNLIALGREVDRMFGKYGKFSPAWRRSIATWTPFVPWSLNAVHFITQHLPADHPVATALIASAHQASQEWRNRHGLGYFVDGKVPPFLQGSVPGSQGSHWLIFTQGTPFGVAGDPTGSAARGFNPLGQTILNNLSGADWKGDKFKNPNPIYNMEQAVISLVEATTPVGYAANRLGASSGNKKSFSQNLKDWANPYHPVQGKKDRGGKKGPFDTKPASSKSDNPFDSGKSKKKSSNPFDG